MCAKRWRLGMGGLYGWAVNTHKQSEELVWVFFRQREDFRGILYLNHAYHNSSHQDTFHHGPTEIQEPGAFPIIKGLACERTLEVDSGADRVCPSVSQSDTPLHPQPHIYHIMNVIRTVRACVNHLLLCPPLLRLSPLHTSASFRKLLHPLHIRYLAPK